ncbi:MAG: efflux RND transporter periplasmic adaptor subunit [Enhydrobacter sp.]|nr:MAG: efflux RND transporter periplasmic adaptor subunit [Enhydrobacter sp.]
MKPPAWLWRAVGAVVAIGLVAVGIWWSTGKPAAPPAVPAAPPPPQVGVVELKEAEVPLPLEFAGRVAGFRVVEIRAQVSGVLLKREFSEGDTVREGEVLFRIDPRTYEAALSRVQAQAAQARAALTQAEENYKRVEGLAGQKVATQKALEDAIAARDQARATIQSTQAEIDTARLNLEFTTIKAPVTGATSLVSPAEGTLIQAQQTVLTTITQLDPAYVNFTITDSELRRLNAIDEENEKPIDLEQVGVELQFGDGARYPAAGKIDTRSRTVDPRTGTILFRAVFPNPDRALLPGQFVRIRINGISMPRAIVVPKAAISQGPLGAFVYVVEPDQVARVRQVRLYMELDNGWIVRKGLKGGDRIVADGVIRVRPGQPVRAVPIAPSQTAVPAAAKP